MTTDVPASWGCCLPSPPWSVSLQPGGHCPAIPHSLSLQAGGGGQLSLVVHLLPASRLEDLFSTHPSAHSLLLFTLPYVVTVWCDGEQVSSGWAPRLPGDHWMVVLTWITQ